MLCVRGVIIQERLTIRTMAVEALKYVVSGTIRLYRSTIGRCKMGMKIQRQLTESMLMVTTHLVIAVGLHIGNKIITDETIAPLNSTERSIRLDSGHRLPE